MRRPFWSAALRGAAPQAAPTPRLPGRNLSVLLLALVASVTIGPVTQASAATHNVIIVAAGVADDSTGNPANCPSDSAGLTSGPDCTLRDAVALSTQDGPGDTIELPSGDTLLESQITITVPVSIVGQLGGDSEIEQNGSDARVLSIEPADSGTFEIANTEILGGHLRGDTALDCVGAGVYVDGDGGPADPVMFKNDNFTNNEITAVDGTAGVAAQGGGLYLTGPDAFTVEGTGVGGNTVVAGTDANQNGEPAEGGGIYYDGTTSGSSLTVDGGSTINDNLLAGPQYDSDDDGPQAAGGGIYVDGAGSTLIGTANTNPTAAQLANDGVSISHNSVTAGGGGKVGGTAYGGGIDAASPVLLRGVTVSDNTVTGGSETGGDSGAPAYGGGVNIAGGPSTIDFSTISGNNAVSDLSGNADTVGGVSVATGPTTERLTVYESTIADNGSGDNGKEIPVVGGLSANGPTILDASTVADNAGSQAANVFEGADALTATDALVADAGSGQDCATAGTGTIGDGSGNYSDDDSCGFSFSNGSTAVPGYADLGSLAENRGDGGPETLLPGPGSLALGTGKGCASEDERGFALQTSSICDAGAVQIQLPTNTVAPAITPTSPTAGQALSCSSGTWAAGDTQISGYTYKWLEGSTVLSTASTYTTTPADTGQAITCQVTATNNYSTTAPATSAAVTPAAPAASGGSGSSGSGGSGSGGSGSGGSGSSQGESSGTSAAQPAVSTQQTGATVKVSVKLPGAVRVKRLSIAWEQGAGFSPRLTLKQLAKALSVRSLAGAAVSFTVTRGPYGRVTIGLRQPVAGLVLRVNATALTLSKALARSLRTHHSHTVTATVTLATTTGTTYREGIKVTV